MGIPSSVSTCCTTIPDPIFFPIKRYTRACIFVQQVKMSHGTLKFCISECLVWVLANLCFWYSFLVICLGGIREQFKYLDSCHPWVRHGWVSDSFLQPDWPNTAGVSQCIDTLSAYFFLCLCLSAFQEKLLNWLLYELF